MTAGAGEGANLAHPDPNTRETFQTKIGGSLDGTGFHEAPETTASVSRNRKRTSLDEERPPDLVGRRHGVRFSPTKQFTSSSFEVLLAIAGGIWPCALAPIAQ
jgi:hypothetical protein